ncbi:UDP-glucosyltransferase 2-like isoform X1 [Choristoneura fumiferana]|uniref:UDP-glucosyltransferase 2-like isoform X1 n=2 Tax=Choristoneura fumiferana TaxID=7141 RepID=UPI003D1582A0
MAAAIMKLVTTLLLSTLLTSCVSNAYKVLIVFPLASGKSHGILGEAHVTRLLDAGHEVTYIAGILTKVSSPRLRQIDVTSNAALSSSGQHLDFKYLLAQKDRLSFSRDLAKLCLLVANSTLMNDQVQRLMHDPKEQFDVVIVEWLFSELFVGLASVFNCPLIWSSSLEPHGKILSLIDDDPNPAYVPDIMSDILPPFTFSQRVIELWKLIKGKYIIWEISFEAERMYELAFASAVGKRGRKLPPYQEARYNASFVLGNSHISAGQATRLPQNYASIAGYHIQETVKPLPEDLQKIMDNAKNGVIYFSMGSMLQTKTMPDELKTGLLNMLGGLQHTVIWKIEEIPAKIPKNVHIVTFAPQQSILAHPNCILFITHGGLLSTTETLHYGVPIIGIPVFGDQFINVNRAVHKGFAKVVSLGYDTPVHLKAAIDDMLGNPRYRKRVKELSFIYHDRLVPPGKELVYRVEHVVKTGGAPHLRSPALMLPLYQKMYLDLLLVVIVVLYAMSYMFEKLLNKLNTLFRKQKSLGKQKTN